MKNLLLIAVLFGAAACSTLKNPYRQPNADTTRSEYFKVSYSYQGTNTIRCYQRASGQEINSSHESCSEAPMISQVVEHATPDRFLRLLVHGSQQKADYCIYRRTNSISDMRNCANAEKLDVYADSTVAGGHPVFLAETGYCVDSANNLVLEASACEARLLPETTEKTAFPENMRDISSEAVQEMNQ
ncbi:MAG: hypothetical protein K2Q26_04295 [Bdellovibrionales bacterium]|nr:hypothetical protein [Bdellovibrionales bacterium]